MIVNDKGFSEQFIISDENLKIINKTLKDELSDNNPDNIKKVKNLLKIEVSGLSDEAIDEIKSFVEFVKLKNNK
jgi:hypothetical protein